MEGDHSFVIHPGRWCQGGAPNFTVRGVVQTTVNANGDVTALVNHFTSTGDCTP
jgi:hypothetical protein